MNNDENIHTWLRNIAKKLIIESEEIKKLSSYKGSMFLKKEYDVILKDDKYVLNEKIANDCPAIYIFYSPNGIDSIPASFNDVKYGSKAKPQTSENKKFVYLGKTYTVGERIGCHLESKDSSPYSLKYNHENRKNVLKNTVLYVFELKQEFKEYKEVILSTIETNLHISCEPLIGSRRV